MPPTRAYSPQRSRLRDLGVLDDRVEEDLRAVGVGDDGEVQGAAADVLDVLGPRVVALDASGPHDHRTIAVPDHVQGDIQHDDQTDVGDPAVLVQQARDEGGSKAHQGDRQHKADDQHGWVFAGSTGNREHVIKAHRHVGQHDLQRGLTKGFARGAAGNHAVGVPTFQFNAGVDWDVPGLQGVALNARMLRTGGQGTQRLRSRRKPLCR